MSFLSVLLALLIEQLRALPERNPVHASLRTWANWSRTHFDAGRTRHALVVWSVAVALPALACVLLYNVLAQWSVVLALAFNVLVLYATLGFRQFSHFFTEVRDALAAGDEATARQALARWRNVDASELPRSELVRQVIEHSVISAHRHVFGVLFWFLLGSALFLGPAGALVYRMSEFVARYWAAPPAGPAALAGPSPEPGMDSQLPPPALSRLSARTFEWLDWLPARITALGFAMVGNFEETLASWRRHSQQWSGKLGVAIGGHDGDGVILAAAAGALGVRLGGAAGRVFDPLSSQRFTAGAQFDDTAATGGAMAEPAHLASLVGLIWRSVVLWMLLLALMTLARLVG
jgi:adenosylcobinamide-phosphate synthase